MSSTRFHKAAKDGLINILKEATRKDANAKDNDSMTPVLWAAFEGHLDALRLLCGRGGDPDKSDQFGNTALHLAAAKGHLYCVDFLVKFGVNIYALDIDKHSAKDLAAINNRDDILRFLDVAITNFEACNRKKAKALKEFSEKQCEKRMREFMRTQKLDQQNCMYSTSTVRKQQQQQHVIADRDTQKFNTTRNHSGSMLSTLKQKIWSSQGNLNKAANGSTKFNDLSTTSSSAHTTHSCRSLSVSFMNCGAEKNNDLMRDASNERVETNEISAKETELTLEGVRAVKLRNGYNNDSDGTLTLKKEHKAKQKCRREQNDVRESSSEGTSDGYVTLARSRSQPYLEYDTLEEDQTDRETEFRSFLEHRPMFGRRPLDSLSSRRSVAAALNQLADSASQTTSSQSGTIISKNYNKCAERKLLPQFAALSVSDDDIDNEADMSEDEEQNVNRGPLALFLILWGLEEFLPIFHKQRIDLDTLMLLTEEDLKSLGLPLGPFRKLYFAIQERRNALGAPGLLIDSQV